MNISNMINKKIDKKISNKKQEEIKYYIRIGVTLLIISAVTATLLAFVNAMTKDRIAANELAVMEEALDKIFVGCDEIKSVGGGYDEPVLAVYEVYSNGEKLGYGIQVNPVGFKEEIGMIVGADKAGNCLGVEITSISDTPGVGTKVKEMSFLSGFEGLNGESVSEYDTISGATISSKAVKRGVEAALQLDIFGDSVESEEGGSDVREDISEDSEETALENIDESINDIINALEGGVEASDSYDTPPDEV